MRRTTSLANSSTLGRPHRSVLSFATMRARISRVFLIAYVVLLLLSGMLLCVPGCYWQGYAITGVCALVAVAVGPRWHRIAGFCAAVLSVTLIVSDLRAGVAFREKIASVRAR